MKKDAPIEDIFRAALAEWIDSEGYGAQARIVKMVGKEYLSPSYLNDLYRGRRKGRDEQLRRRIAKAIGKEYEAFLNRGRELLGLVSDPMESEEHFKYANELERFGEHTDERANAIRLLACRELGLEGGVMDYTLTALGHSNPDLQRYLNREIETDKEYFDLCRNKMENKLKWLEDEIEKMKKMRALFEKDEKT